jgi:hypothetical protein
MLCAAMPGLGSLWRVSPVGKGTVRTHLENIYERLQVSSRTSAITAPSQIVSPRGLSARRGSPVLTALPSWSRSGRQRSEMVAELHRWAAPRAVRYRTRITSWKAPGTRRLVSVIAGKAARPVPMSDPESPRFTI